MKTRDGRQWSRRDVIRLGIVAAGAARVAAKGKTPVGVQLYSVRFDCEKDLAGTLAAIARMGYQGVEFAGYYGRTAEQLRKMLDDNGLKCCGAHLDLKALVGDILARTIEFNQILGNTYLVVPGLRPELRDSRRAWLETARTFNEISEKVKAHGMILGYHNHTVEFQEMDGEKPWDTFCSRTDPEIILQVDVGNAMEGGEDPLALVGKYAPRIGTIHVKEHSRSNPKAYVGEGDVPWKKVFGILEKAGATHWYIVEYEIEGMPPIPSIARCLQNLRKLGV